MSHDNLGPSPLGIQGPRAWALSILGGICLGFLLSMATSLAPLNDGAATVAHADEGPGGLSDFLSPATAEASPPRVTDNPNDHESEPYSGYDRAHDTDHEDDHEDDGHDDAAHGHAEDGDAHGGHHDDAHGGHGPAFDVPLWLCVPFGIMLLSIAIMPFISMRVWEHHFPDFAFALGSTVASYYLFEMGESGREAMLHVLMEYYAFIGLIGSLFVASGGLLVDIRKKGTPMSNTALLAFGAVIANVIGTTGASVVLIRPFMRMNQGRLRPLHVIMFIFTVSNCGGALTPIGDPPLYLGFLRGVPFEWTLINLWPMWLLCVGILLAMFYAIDTMYARKDGPKASPEPSESTGGAPVRVAGLSAALALVAIVGAVFVDPLLGTHGVGPTIQILIAIMAYKMANPAIHESNGFTFFPVKEVGFLFIGIFCTMAPALQYLSIHGHELGIETPTQFYFATGSLSACLDNAPTYLNFLQAEFGTQGLALTPENVQTFLEPGYHPVLGSGETASFTGASVLMAISLGAVFFGAMTYIGNGPNFMVKAIAEAGGMKMPSFFGYLGYSVVLLAPVLAVVWLVFVR